MKKLLLILIIFVTILTTGCWDMIEINQRIFPYSAALDINEDEKEKLLVTFSYPNINAIGKSATQDKRIHIVSTAADNIFQAGHNLTTRLQYPIYYKHLKVLILSEEVAKNQELVREVVDGLNRDFIINKTIQMVVVKKSGKDLLEAVPKAARQEVVEGTLYSLLINNQRSTEFTSKTMTNFIEDMDVSKTSVVPVATAGHEEIVMSGGAIFKDYSLVGYIDAMENMSLAMLTNKVKEDGIDTDYKGVNLSILATGVKSKKKLDNNKGNLKVSILVEIEGQIHEYILGQNFAIDTNEKIQDMEKAIEDTLKKQFQHLIDKLQKEFNADLLGVSEYLNKFHHKTWQEVEKDWDRVFPYMDISVEVDMKIRRRGLTK